MKSPIFYILTFVLCSCAVQRATTSEEFVRDVQRDLPFKVSELKAVSGRENTYLFRSDGYIGLLPDYEVDSECLCAAIGDGAVQRLRHLPLGCE